MPNSSNDGRGQVKDPQNDGRLKENKGSGGSSRGGSSTPVTNKANAYAGSAHTAIRVNRRRVPAQAASVSTRSSRGAGRGWIRSAGRSLMY